MILTCLIEKKTDVSECTETFFSFPIKYLKFDAPGKCTVHVIFTHNYRTQYTKCYYDIQNSVLLFIILPVMTTWVFAQIGNESK